MIREHPVDELPDLHAVSFVFFVFQLRTNIASREPPGLAGRVQSVQAGIKVDSAVLPFCACLFAFQQ